MQATQTRQSEGRKTTPRWSVGPSWWFALPALVMYALVTVYPSLAGTYFALTKWDGLSPTATFVGLGNFVKLLHESEAIGALKNTVLIAVVATLLQNGLGLLLALGVNSHIRSRYVLRVIFFAPVMLSPLIVAYLFQYIYSPRGFVNNVLGAMGLEPLQRAWLGDPSIAIWSVIVVIVWQYVGYSMVIFLAGLQGVPQELYDAADMDGASGWQRFKNVTLPMIAPAITINLTLSVIGGLKIFDQVWAMTQGGPGYATETLSVFLYRQAFAFGNYGYGMAIALVLTIIVMAVSVVQLRVLRSREVEG